MTSVKSILLISLKRHKLKYRSCNKMPQTKGMFFKQMQKNKRKRKRKTKSKIKSKRMMKNKRLKRHKSKRQFQMMKSS